MKKIIAALMMFGAMSAQACEIEGKLKWCVEVSKSDTEPYVVVDGQRSNDFKVEKYYGSYLKVTYLKPITKNFKGELVVLREGKEVRKQIAVTTKNYEDGSKVEKGVGGFLEALKPGK
jgi:hypothetical protein